MSVNTEIRFSELLATFIRYKWVFFIIFGAFFVDATHQLLHPDPYYQFTATLSTAQLSEESFSTLAQTNTTDHSVTPSTSKFGTLRFSYHFPDIMISAQGKQRNFNEFISQVNSKRDLLANQMQKMVPSLPEAPAPTPIRSPTQVKMITTLLTAERNQKILLEKMIRLYYSNQPSPLSLEEIKSTSDLAELSAMLKKNGDLISSLNSLANSLSSTNEKIDELKLKITVQPRPAAIVASPLPQPTLTISSTPQMEVLPDQVSGKDCFKLICLLGVCFGLIGVFTVDEGLKAYRAFSLSRRRPPLCDDETGKTQPC